MSDRVASLPHVTVCVPAFNAERTLRRTLDSILAQDYTNFDVLVCDNASTDNTAQIAREYAARGVRYALNPVHTDWGESNWNHALSLAEGPLIALYHADDLYIPTMVRRQVDFLEAHADASAVFTMTRMIDEQDRPIRLGTTRLPKELRGQECFAFPMLLNAVLKYGNFLTVPTLMTRRVTLDTVGVFNYEQFCTASDIDLWLRMARCKPVGIIDEPLHRYRLSSTQGSVQIHRRRTLRAHFFWVLDHYLSLPDIGSLVQPQARAYYDMERSVDDIRCVINLLAAGETKEASARLVGILCLDNFYLACRRPRQLVYLLAGVGLRIGISIRLGGLLGQCMHASRREWARIRWS